MSEPMWHTHLFEGKREAHVIREDLKPDHHATRTCPCQPSIEEVPCADGKPGWVVVHAGKEHLS